MAHIIVEYSANLDSADTRCRELLSKLAEAAGRTGLLPVPGLRARAHRCDHFQVGDGHADGAFVHVQLRIGPGRSEADRERIAAGLFNVLKDFYATDSTTRALALSLELVELGIRHNLNNMRQYDTGATTTP